MLDIQEEDGDEERAAEAAEQPEQAQEEPGQKMECRPAVVEPLLGSEVAETGMLHKINLSVGEEECMPFFIFGDGTSVVVVCQVSPPGWAAAVWRLMRWETCALRLALRIFFEGFHSLAAW